MRRFISFKVLVAILIFATTGCQKEDIEDDAVITGDIAVKLTSNIAPAAISKSHTGNREVANEAGLYMVKAGQPIASANAVYGNARNVLLNATLAEKQTLLVSQQAIMYPASGNVDFIAYYPYSASVGSDYTLDVNIANQSAVLPAEVIYSNNAADLAPTDKAVNLNFIYPLAKLQITLRSSQQLTPADYMAMKVTIEGAYTQAKLKLENGELVNRKEIKPIKMHNSNVTYSSAVFEAVLLPTEETDDKITFIIEIAGQTYRYEQSVNYRANTLYICDLNVDAKNRIVTLRNVDKISRNAKQPVSIDGEESLSFMTMKTDKAGTVMFGIGGSGKMLIDWGDGKSEIFEISGKKVYAYTYSNSTHRNISIYGENIYHFDCGRIDDNTNHLTHLDVSGNMALTALRASDNKFVNLNLTQNTALTKLICANNHITEIDLSNNTALLELHLNDNKLSKLDISALTDLDYLCCQNNHFEKLDISKNPALLILDCSQNKLTHLDVTANHGLLDLRFCGNQIADVNLSNNINLATLFCEGNKLSSFDISRNSALTRLHCTNNQLAFLDISKNTALASLYCAYNQLTALNVSNNHALTEILCNHNNFNAVALNNLFDTLNGNNININGYSNDNSPPATGSKVIFISDNPGTANCNRNVAINKGWTIK